LGLQYSIRTSDVTVMNKDNSTKMHLIGKVSEAGERHMGWGLAELSIGWFDPWIGSGRVGSLANCKLHC